MQMLGWVFCAGGRHSCWTAYTLQTDAFFYYSEQASRLKLCCLPLGPTMGYKSKSYMYLLYETAFILYPRVYKRQFSVPEILLDGAVIL